jgi:hypothetical protein
MPRACTLLLLLGSTACLPATELGAGGGGPGALDGAAAAAEVLLLEPWPGAVAPINLAAVVLRLPAPLRAGEARAQLRPGEGAPLALGPAEPIECSGAGRCYAFAVGGPLPAGRYTVAGPAGAHFEDGRSLPEGPAGVFTVEPERDETPPAVEPPLVEVVGDCLRVRFGSDEPVRASLEVSAGGIEERRAAGEGRTRFDLAARFSRLPAGVAGALVVRAIDWAGNRGHSGPVPIRAPPPPVPLVITEVLPNPAGPEATQEFVELQNLGTAPVSLEGLTLEDAGGGDPLPAVTLEPGAFAVVVPAQFDEADGRDPAPRAGVMLLRVEGKIGRDGIGSAAEAVRLRGKGGEVLSRYGGWIDTSPSAWTGRSVERQPPKACDDASSWSASPQLPTPGW